MTMNKNTNIDPNIYGQFSGFSPEITGRCKMCNDKLQPVDRGGICFSCDMLDGSSIDNEDIFANWGDFHEPKDKQNL